MSEALTHRHVDFLRDLMESKAREGLENGTIEIVEDLQTLGLVKHDLISGVGFRYWATPAGRILVATIDSERERVLAEVDERVEELAINDATISVFFDGDKAVIGTHETQRPYHEEGSGRTFSAALDACTTPRHRLANPQGETDRTEGEK